MRYNNVLVYKEVLKLKRHRKYILLLILCLFIFNCSFVNTRVESLEQLENLAVTLIIDKSGSMNETDPSKLRETAAEIFIDLLSPEDNLGIISFDNEAIEIQPMVNLKGTTRESIKANIKGKLEANGDTDYQKAFQMAFNQLDSFPEQNVKKVIIFLTDGNPDPDPTRLAEAGFIDNYMNGFWDTMKTIGSKEYPVYSVGFGTLDKTVMDRIALETKGQSTVFATPSEVAVEFFNILSQLKNRVSLLDETYSVNGEKNVEFEMNQYASQTTITIVNTPGDFNLELIPPQGVVIDGKVSLEKTPNYTLITLNQTDEDLVGKWVLKMYGTSEVAIFGASDLFVKIWATEPMANSQHSINSPIIVNAKITGDISDKAVVEGILTINGVQTLNPIYLKKQGMTYIGQFDDTKISGKYDIELRVKEKDSVISSTTSYVHVKELPKLTSDLASLEMGFSLSEKKAIISTLELGSLKLMPSDDLVIEEYHLLVKYKSGEQEIFPMTDDGNIKAGDAKAEDGNFSTQVIFNKEGPANISLSVRGLYKNEIFILEKNLGDTVIYPIGVIKVSIPTDTIDSIKGNAVKIPLNISNTSNFPKVINIKVPEELGTIENDKIKVDPLTETQVAISFIPSEKTVGNIIDFSIDIFVENQLTIVDKGNLDARIEITTKLSRFLSVVRSKTSLISIILSIVLIVMILTYILGMILYRLKIKPRNMINGKLLYIKIKDDVDDYLHSDTKEIPLNKNKKNNVVITFNPDKRERADFFIEGSNSKFDLIIEKKIEKGKHKFIDGYKSLKQIPDNRIFVRCTPPGILSLKNSIITNLEITEDLFFESGGFLFKYESIDKHYLNNTSKNILEGRM